MTAPSDDLKYNQPAARQVRPKTAERLAVLEQLLRLQPLAILAGQGEGSGGTDSRTLYFSNLYADVVGQDATHKVWPHWLELERCLAVMAHERNWQRCHVVAYFQAPTRLTSKRLPVQKLDRYKRLAFDERGRPIFARDNHGKPLTTPQDVLEPVIAPWISAAEAYAGLGWIEERYSHAAFKSAEAALAKLRAA